MKYVIDELPNLEIIKVAVSGTLSQGIRKEIHSKAISALNAKGYHRLLIDLTDSIVAKNYTNLNSLEMVSHMIDVETKDNIQMALLSTQMQSAHDSFVKLVQIIGKKKHTKHFRNFDEAITWLLDGKDIFT